MSVAGRCLSCHPRTEVVMSKKHKGGPGPIPPANQPHQPESPETPESPHPDEKFQEHDPKRRLGDYTATGEHARQQPSSLNDGETHSK